MTARTDDYIKNMIRRMLVAEGWTRPPAPERMTQKELRMRQVMIDAILDPKPYPAPQ